MSRRSNAQRRRKISAILLRDGCCLRCGSTDDLTIDHIWPLSKGGTDAKGNLQTLCGACNEAKADRSISYLAETWT